MRRILAIGRTVPDSLPVRMAVDQHRHHHGHDHAHADRGGRGLRIALGITLLVCALEVGGGIVSGSLALLADAGHLFADAGSLGLAIWAASMAQRPAAGRRTFGFKRAEILAALA